MAAADDETTASPPPPHQHPRNPPYADKLTSIREFSTALTTFLCRYDDLQSHLQSLTSAVDLKLCPEINPPNQTLTLDSAKQETEIESLCTQLSIRGVRRYISENLSNIEKLRAEIPQALKRAHNPADFVLKLVGKFYHQGAKAYDKQSNMIPARKVSILILEFYLLMDRDETMVDHKSKKQGHAAASDWKKRLVSEGGLARADLLDARGLLLLLGCYGVPMYGFSNSDIKDLLLASGASEISGALRRSSVLLERVPAIVEKMMKNKDYKVVDIIYSFGMESRFPPKPFLESFVQSSIETWDKKRKATHGSLTEQMDANKKHLNDLKSVLACIKEHKLDPSELLPDCALTKMISTVEIEISDLKKKIEDQVDKRRLEDPRPRKRIERRDGKRARLTERMPPQHVDHVYLDRRIPCDRLTPPIRVLDGTFPGHLYPPPYDAHSRALHEDAILRERILAERVLAERALVARYANPSALGVNGGFRQSHSLEGFAGRLQNPPGIGSSNQAPAPGSDLYQFADSVAERELYGGPQAVPSVVQPRHSPYLL